MTIPLVYQQVLLQSLVMSLDGLCYT